MEPILKNKRALSQETDFMKCVICRANDTTDVLNNMTKRGIGTFKDALEKRQDQVFERLQGIVHDEDNFLSMKPLCHRSCRSSYTHKKDLEKCVTKRSKKCDDIVSSRAIEDNTLSVGKRSGIPKTLYKTCCFFVW